MHPCKSGLDSVPCVDSSLLDEDTQDTLDLEEEGTGSDPIPMIEFGGFDPDERQVISRVIILQMTAHAHSRERE